MKNLIYKRDYKSIRRYETISLPELTVLTGVNGSGKTHLLQSILSDCSSIGNTPATEIKYFDFKSFYLEAEQEFNNQQIDQEKIQAWDRLSTNPNRINFRSNLEALRKALGNDLDILIEIAAKTNKPFLRLDERDIKEEQLIKKHKEYLNNYNKIYNNSAIANDPLFKSIKAFSYKLDRPIDLLSERDFKDTYTPSYLKNDFLPTQLSKIFLDYKYKEYNELIIKRSEALHYGEQPIINNEDDFVRRYGPKPWIIIEEILASFSTLNFSISNPDNLRFRSDSITNFNVRIKNERTKAEIPFSDLSSGEKVLFALVLSIYKSYGDKYFPKILLLDEIDASLHPTMIKNLLGVINDIFVKRHGVQVILATHSPSTIALAPDESIFIVNPGDASSKIEKQDKATALDILTEGFMSLEQGVCILDASSQYEINIFTEGNNIRYIKKAIEILLPEQKERINVIKGIADRSGTKQLSILYDFFLRLEHKNHIIFVYDCDEKRSFKKNEKTDYLILSQNENNNKFRNGIENAFPEKLILDEHYIEATKTRENGEIITTKTPNKNQICDHIINNANIDDYKLFIPLIDLIKTKIT